VAPYVGLSASVFIDSTLVGLGLQLIYSSEVDRAKGLGVAVHQRAPQRPGENERLLRVVRNGPDNWYIPAIALHWIMERTDGSVMDPAGPEGGSGPGVGLESNTFAGLVDLRRRQGVSYIDTGVGILLCPAR
jgi:hypothetical protein